jgi:hypothetical protein
VGSFIEMFSKHLNFIMMVEYIELIRSGKKNRGT